MTLAATAAIALIAGGKPSEARAADGTTDVTVQVAEGDENLAWSVPTQIPMKATAGGTLIGPDADAIAIRNLSAFPIRVKQMDTTAEAPFNLVDDVEKSSGNNDFMMTMNGTAVKQTVELPDDGTWAMGYAENEEGSDKLPLTISGAKIARVTEDLSAAKKAATITWTVNPTKYVKPEPKPDPNGVTFAVYSDNDKSLNFYKRDRKPEVGDMFNGKIVTKLFDVDESAVYNEYNYDDYLFHSVDSITENIEVVDGGIRPVSTAYLFGDEYAYTTAVDVVKLDTSRVTDMAGMFGGCINLKSLDLSSWDTSSVTDMHGMFFCCSSLPSLDFSSWNTSNVTNMREMFYYCSSLTSLDLSSWNTSSVTNMRTTFSSCSSLTNLNLASWDTSSVTDMRNMFSNCTNLTSLNFSRFGTFGAEACLGQMFSGCSSLTSIDLSSWNVSNVTKIYDMFSDCSALTTVGDLSSWDVSNITNMDGMFSGCSALTTVGDLSHWNTSNVIYMSNMFRKCSKLTANCSSWDVSRVSKHENFNDNALGVLAPNWVK